MLAHTVHMEPGHAGKLCLPHLKLSSNVTSLVCDQRSLRRTDCQNSILMTSYFSKDALTWRNITLVNSSINIRYVNIEYGILRKIRSQPISPLKSFWPTINWICGARAAIALNDMDAVSVVEFFPGCFRLFVNTFAKCEVICESDWV